MKRRDFFKSMASVVVIPSLFNGVSAQKLNAIQLMSTLANLDNTDRVLVLVQLKGGNDGLNTVIPIDQYAAYTKARTNIAIPQADVLGLNGYPQTGIHPAMSGLQQKFNEGKIKIIQSVGYPSTNFSHFRATDIWLSASDSSEVISSGWIGRYLDAMYPNFPVGYPNASMPDPLALELGSILSLGFQGPEMNMSISVTDPTNFYNLIDGIQDPIPNTPAGKELAYIRATALQTNQYAASIIQAANNIVQQSPSYPEEGTNSLADQFKIVARLIAGGLKTKVYLVSLTGFDTHNSQVEEIDSTIGTHADLLTKLSVGVSAFIDDLAYLKISNRVVGMTFSEFGRRIMSNKSFGTDHGAAEPMFVFGDKVMPGILGNNPTIPASVTVNDNIPMQYDFRSVYASMLEQWFGIDKTILETVMLTNFQQLPIINNSGTNVKDLPSASGKVLISNYPNPFSSHTLITYESAGGHTSVGIYNTSGQLINTLVDSELQTGTYRVGFDTSDLSSGTYYARLQNNLVQQVIALLKK